MNITDTDKLNALKKFLEVRSIDYWEHDALLAIEDRMGEDIYFQFGEHATIDVALEYLVMEDRSINKENSNE